MTLVELKDIVDCVIPLNDGKVFYAKKKMKYCIFSICYKVEEDDEVFIDHIAIEMPVIDGCVVRFDRCFAIKSFQLGHIDYNDFLSLLEELYKENETELKRNFKQQYVVALNLREQIAKYAKMFDDGSMIMEGYKL